MSAIEWESAFGRLLLDVAFRRLFSTSGPAAFSGYDLDHAELASLLDLDRRSVERFAHGLRLKRESRLRAALPVTIHCLGADRERLLTRYLTAYPSVPTSCAVEAGTFSEVACRHARTIGVTWLTEVIQFELSGHLRSCGGAIDAEGVVSGHLPTMPLDSANGLPRRLDERAMLDLVPTRASDVWDEEYGVDVVAIVEWAMSAATGDDVPPIALLAPGKHLVVRRPTAPGRSTASITLHQPLDRFWRSVDGKASLGRLLRRSSDASLGIDAWLAIVQRFVSRGFICLGPDPPAPIPTRSFPRFAWRTAIAGVATPDPKVPARGEPKWPSWETDSTPRFGIGLRRPYVGGLLDDSDRSATRPDCLEVYADEYAQGDPITDEELARLRARYPLVPHGLELSLGSAVRPEVGYVARLARLVEAIGAPYYTEHLAWTQTLEWRLGHLCPCRLDATALDRIGDRVRLLQESLGVPLAVENISYDVLLPGGGLAEADFLAELAERAQCGLLVDVTNIVVNSKNHGFDALAYVDRLPPERVLQIHLVGYTRGEDGSAIDAHAEATQSDVLELARYLLRRGARPKAVILERDQALPSLPKLLAELDQLRRHLAPVLVS